MLCTCVCAIFALCLLDNFMHGYLCVYYNFRVMHLFAELDMDWIGYGSKSFLLSWIRLGKQIVGLDWILKNGPMRHSGL